jgi:outer membrane immunogenic protein
MKKLLASASLLALSSATVFGADFPMKSAPMAAPVPVFTWTGCYAGAHAGGGSMHDSFTQDNNFSVEAFDTNGNNGTGSGAVAGGQLGCNYQDGNAVFGLEGEGYWSSLKTTTGTSFNETGNAAGTFNFAATTKNRDDFTIAARVGVAFDRTLVYGKAGWVSGNFSFGSVETFTALPTSRSASFTDSVAATKTLNGLLLGAGIEHAFTPNWTVKLEYNFLDFGSGGASFNECASGSPCAITGTTSQHTYKQIFKVGFNYLFNPWGAPVVARY